MATTRMNCEEFEEPARSPDPAITWKVFRQDDHGNRFEMSSGHTREEAEQLVADFEARGHKQHYWAEPTSSEPSS
jgi:hypothetical protein